MTATKNTRSNIHKKKQARSQPEWPGTFRVYGRIFEQLKQNPQPVLFFAIIYLAFALASSIAQGRRPGMLGYHNYEDVVQIVFLLALPTYGLALADGRKLSISEVMAFDLRKYLYIFLALILFLGSVLVSVLLLIVPVIWVVGWFSLHQFPIVENGATSVEALKESKRLAQQHKGLVWGVIGVSLLVSLPGIILTVIPFASPAYAMFPMVLTDGALAVLYRYLQQTAVPLPKR